MEVSGTRTSGLQTTQQATQLQKTAQVREQSASTESRASAPPPPEPARPVVNTQGQMTGRLLNVTA